MAMKLLNDFRGEQKIGGGGEKFLLTGAINKCRHLIEILN